jgi:hypothetical protein
MWNEDPRIWDDPMIVKNLNDKFFDSFNK